MDGSQAKAGRGVGVAGCGFLGGGRRGGVCACGCDGDGGRRRGCCGRCGGGGGGGIAWGEERGHRRLRLVGMGRRLLMMDIRLGKVVGGE